MAKKTDEIDVLAVANEARRNKKAAQNAAARRRAAANKATGESRLSGRGPGFGIASWRVDGMDPVAVHIANASVICMIKKRSSVCRHASFGSIKRNINISK